MKVQIATRADIPIVETRPGPEGGSREVFRKSFPMQRK